MDRAAPENPQAVAQQGTAEFSNTPSEAPAGSDWSLDGVLSAPVEPDELGRLGGFRILRLLGQGGMGAVFEAEDIRLKRRVAVKIVRPDVMQRGTARDRFLREARAAARVEDPHIIPIYQIDEANGVLFIAMPLLGGESLEQRLNRDHTLPAASAVAVASGIAKGLRAAHAKGLIHRDIKPANLWLEPDPESADFLRVKVLDFGLARAVHDDTHLTAAGGILGTPAYMSPEQAAGEAVDERTDLFSLGAVLYRMLTGQLPFPGNSTMAILTALASKQPPPIRILRPDVPAELDSLVMQLLAKQPASRTASAEAVIAALARVQDSLRDVAATRTAMLAAPARRKPRWKWPVAIAVAVLLAGIGLFAAIGDVTVKVKSPDGKETEVRVPPGSKVGVDEKGNVTVELPKALSPRAKEADDLEFTLQAGTGFVQSIAQTPDGRTLISGGQDGVLRVWNLESRTLVGSHTFKEAIRSVALHPDGRTVAVSTDSGELLTWDHGTGKVVRRYRERLQANAAGCWYMAFARNGKWIVVTDHARRAVVSVDVETGESTDLAPILPKTMHCVFGVSPDGEHLAVAGTAQTLQVFKLPGKELIWEADWTASEAAPLISADNRRVTLVSLFASPLLTLERGKSFPAAVRLAGMHLHGTARHGTLLAGVNGSEQCRIRVWSGDAPEPVWESRGPAGAKSAQRVQFSRDGKRLFTTHDNGVIAVFRVPPDCATKPPRAFPALDPAWAAKLRGLPADAQFKEVQAELVRRNPGLEAAHVTAWLDAGTLRSIGIVSDAVEDVTPLRAIPNLRGVEISGARFARVEQLQGLKLETARLRGPYSDVKPLAGMPLSELFLENSLVVDLSPLAGSKISNLSLSGSPVRDLSPLAGMPLDHTFFLHNFREGVDLAPLKSSKLRYVVLPATCTSDLSPLAATPVEHIRVINERFRFTPEQRSALQRIRSLKIINDVPAAEYWKKIDAESGPREPAPMPRERLTPK